MDSLPASALKVIGQHLDAQDALSCRLAARCLAPVAARQLPTSHIRVVANSFQLQLQQEISSSSSSRSGTADKASAADTAIAASVEGLLIGSKDNNALQHHNAPASNPTAAAAAEGVTSSPAFRSRTAASLARAAAAESGCSKAVVYVDVQQKYTDQTWPEMFGALLSSSSITSLSVVEYSSNSLDHDTKKTMELRRMRADMASTAAAAAGTGPSDPDQAVVAESPYPAAAGTAGSSNWLPFLVSAYTSISHPPGPTLEHLELQLPAPLPVHLQPLLLQLTGLRTLTLGPTRVWPEPPPGCGYLGPTEQVLGAHVLQGLTRLSNLESLTCCIAATANTQEDSKAAVMLQQTFSDLGGRLTHLSFGTSPRSTEIQLSAPLVSMRDLRSLTCQPGFYLDTDDAVESLSEDLAAAAAAAIGSGSSPRLQIAPSLTQLVLNEGSDHGSLLRLLAGQGSSSAAAAAAARSRTQLAHLELNSQRELPVEMLSQLAGLRQLKTVIEDKHNLNLLCKCPLTSQLQGLTLLCKQPGIEYDEWALIYRPIPPVTSFIGLQSLVISGRRSIVMNIYKDFELLCALKNLRHLTIRAMLNYYDAVRKCSDRVMKVPGELRNLIVEVYPSGGREGQISHVRFAVAAFPSCLTSMDFKGFYVELVDQAVQDIPIEIRDGTSHAAEITPPSSVSKAAASSMFSESSSSSSGGGGGGSGSKNDAGLHYPGLVELTAEFSTRCLAQEFLRCCPNLHTLGVSLPLSDGTGSMDLEQLWLSQLCLQLRNLNLNLAGNNEDGTNQWQLADEVFETIWQGITDLGGLHKLSISTAGSLSYTRLVSFLSSLSRLIKLQDLSLQCKIDVGQCISTQNDEQPHLTTTATPGDPSHSDDPPTATAIDAVSSVAEEECLQRFCHATRSLRSPLFIAIHGCTGLRRLVLDVQFVMMQEQFEQGVRAEVCHKDSVFPQGPIVLQMPNCLVLGCEQIQH